MVLLTAFVGVNYIVRFEIMFMSAMVCNVEYAFICCEHFLVFLWELWIWIAGRATLTIYMPFCIQLLHERLGCVNNRMTCGIVYIYFVYFPYPLQSALYVCSWVKCYKGSSISEYDSSMLKQALKIRYITWKIF